MNDNDLLTAYLQNNFPSISETSITDPELREIWLNKAKAWAKQFKATGFELALIEFRRLRKTGTDGALTLRPNSDRATLQMACKALRKAGLMS